MKRAIVYTRFSPRKNADECESCETQFAYCEQYAHKHGLTIAEQIHDKDASGKDEYREKLWEAIEALNKGDVLLVYKRDRLARNLYLSEQINRAVEMRGGTIEAVTGDVSGNGNETVLLRQIIAAMAEYERKLIGARTRHAMQLHQRNGRRMGRYAPYGWAIDPADPRRMIPVEREQWAVAKIGELWQQGKTHAEIARTLNADEEYARASRTGKWSLKTVWKIVGRAQ